MDRRNIALHYPNMSTIPTYALYGEAETGRQHDWLHWETIQSRSRQHGYRIAPHRHEQFFQLLDITGGWAGVHIDGEAFDVQRRGIVVVPALSVHSFAFSNDVEGIVVTLMERDLVATGIELPPPGVIAAEGAAVGEALDRLIAEADRPKGRHDLAMRAHLMLLMVNCIAPTATMRRRGIAPTGRGCMRRLSAFWSTRNSAIRGG